MLVKFGNNWIQKIPRTAKLDSAYGGLSLLGLFRVNWNLEILVFKERGKPEYPEKNLSEQGREQTTNWQCAFPHIRMFSFLDRECINLRKGRLCDKIYLNSILKGCFFMLKDFVQSLELQTIAKKSLQFYMFRT